MKGVCSQTAELRLEMQRSRAEIMLLSDEVAMLKSTGNKKDRSHTPNSKTVRLSTFISMSAYVRRFIDVRGS